MAFIVAIDGTAGSGKGTVTEKLAKKFKLLSIDTGAMYRCVALETINKKIAINDKEQIINLLKDIKIDLNYENEKLTVLLNGQDVSKDIRTRCIAKNTYNGSYKNCIKSVSNKRSTSKISRNAKKNSFRKRCNNGR